MLCPPASSLHAASEPQQPVQLVAFYYPPFYTNETKPVSGIAVDVGDELFRRLEMKTELTMYPLKRALNNLETGHADAVMILIKTTERQKYLQYTRPIMTVRGLIWTVGKPVPFYSLEDLRNYKIGVTQGYSYGEDFDSLLKTMQVETANTDYHNYLKLKEHRIDIFPGNEIVAKGLFKKHPELSGQFVHSENSFINWVLRMAVSKKSPLVAKLPEINRILAEMEEEGFIDEVVKRYTE